MDNIKAGDFVIYKNDYGVEFGPHTVVSFANETLHGRTVYIDTDSFWVPVRPSSLRPWDVEVSVTPGVDWYSWIRSLVSIVVNCFRTNHKLFPIRLITDSVERANLFCEEHPETGVILERDGFIIVADCINRGWPSATGV